MLRAKILLGQPGTGEEVVIGEDKFSTSAGKATADVRAADELFLLPRLPHKVALLGERAGWRSALSYLGVEVVALSDRPDLVVSSGDRAAEAAAGGPDQLLLAGGGARTARAYGYSVRRLLPLPAPDRPDLIIPLDRPAVARYALRGRTAANRGLRRLTTGLGSGAVSAGLTPPGRVSLAVCSRKPEPPSALGAARSLGIPTDSDWYLWLGRGDALQRVVFSVFRSGERTPDWVLKITRIPGGSQALEREEASLRGLSVAPEVASHVPTFLGRTSIEGRSVSAETAAVGMRLTEVLVSARESTALSMVRGVVNWLYKLAVATREAPDLLVPELERLRSDVFPFWEERFGTGFGSELLKATAGSPCVTQHNDVGAWNIVAAPPDFTVVDWESSRARGLPLWDLVYFLTGAFAEIDRTRPADRPRHALGLLRGDSRWSALVFEALRRFVAGLAIPPDTVGPAVTLCWLHHGVSALRREERLDRLSARTGSTPNPMEELAVGWMTDRRLGPTWDGWRGPEGPGSFRGS